MKSNSSASFTFRRSLACAVLASMYVSAASAEEYVGRLVRITDRLVTIENVGDFKINLANAQCFDHRGDKTTCATLAGIGYADSARVRVIGDAVQRIDVLKLQQ